MRWEARCPLCDLRIKKRGGIIPSILPCTACGASMIIQRFVRKALWRYAGKIYFCNPCYENWAETADFDPLLVERLSDDDHDFDRISPRILTPCSIL